MCCESLQLTAREKKKHTHTPMNVDISSIVVVVVFCENEVIAIETKKDFTKITQKTEVIKQNYFVDDKC